MSLINVNIEGWDYRDAVSGIVNGRGEVLFGFQSGTDPRDDNHAHVQIQPSWNEDWGVVVEGLVVDWIKVEMGRINLSIDADKVVTALIKWVEDFGSTVGIEVC